MEIKSTLSDLLREVGYDEKGVSEFVENLVGIVAFDSGGWCAFDSEMSSESKVYASSAREAIKFVEGRATHAKSISTVTFLNTIYFSQHQHDYYFVNASRPKGMLDFLFPEYDTFEDLEHGVNLLVALGYEINGISLHIGGEE